MDTKFFEEYQQQLLDWQKKFFDTWLDSFPKAASEMKFPETFESGLQLQEDMVNKYLEAQEQTSQMMIEAQKQFWHNYFDLMRKQPVGTSN